MIVVFPDHTHFLQRSRCFGGLCVTIYLDFGVNKNRIWGKNLVSKIHLSHLLAEAVVHSKKGILALLD